MMTSPLCRSLCAPIAQALTAARVAAPPAGTVWDEGTALNTTVAGGGLVASTTNDSIAHAKTLPARSIGKRAIKFTASFVDAVGTCGLGFVANSWDVTNEYPGAATGGGVAYYNDSQLLSEAWSPATISLPFASGEDGFGYVDQASGKGWFDNESDSTAADREAGTNPHFTFPPGTSLVLAFDAYSADGITPTSITLDPTYTSGTFAAWDS